MRARLYAISRSKGDYLFFLDSHVEVMEFWMEPVLSRMTENYRNVVVPTISTIDKLDFKVFRGFCVFFFPPVYYVDFSKNTHSMLDLFLE